MRIVSNVSKYCHYSRAFAMAHMHSSAENPPSTGFTADPQGRNAATALAPSLTAVSTPAQASVPILTPGPTPHTIRRPQPCPGRHHPADAAGAETTTSRAGRPCGRHDPSRGCGACLIGSRRYKMRGRLGADAEFPFSLDHICYTMLELTLMLIETALCPRT